MCRFRGGGCRAVARSQYERAGRTWMYIADRMGLESGCVFFFYHA